MASKVGKIAIDLEARTANFKRAMNDARKTIQTNSSQMAKAMDRVRGGFDGTMRSLAGFRGAMLLTAGGAGFLAFIKKSIDAADELSKFSKQLGMSTEQLSTLQYAAKLANVDLDVLRGGLIRFSRNVTDATMGLQTAKDSFSGLGIEVHKSDGTLKTSRALLSEIADKYAGMSDGVAKTATATMLFGRSGAQLIPLLDEGSKGIEKLEQAARKMGLELSTQAGQAAEYFNDRLTDLRQSASGLGREMITELLPKFNTIIQVMLEAKKEGGLLAAVWAGLGGLGAMMFTNQLDSTVEKLEMERRNLEKLKNAKPLFGITPAYQAQIDAQAKIVRGLEEQVAKEKKLEAVKRERAAADEKARQAAADKIAADLQANKDKEAAEKAAAAADKARIQRGEASVTSLQKELTLKADATEAEKMIWETEKGRYADLLPAQKQHLIQLAEELDKKQAIADLNQTDIGQYMEKGGILSADDNLGRPAESKMPKTDIGDWMNTGGILSLDDNLSETQDVVDETEDRFKELGDLIQGWGRDSAAAIVDFAAKGKGSFKDLIDSMIQDLLRMMVYQNLTQPFFSWASGGLKGIFSAKGNVFDGGSMVPFARGGVVNRPTIFPMAHGLGLMGEAGPEAVMPLKRTASGDLGVVSGSGGEGMSIFIHAVDAKSFDDLCRRNPGAITDQIMKSLRDNKVRTEMRDLVR